MKGCGLVALLVSFSLLISFRNRKMDGTSGPVSQAGFFIEFRVIYEK